MCPDDLSSYQLFTLTTRTSKFKGRTLTSFVAHVITFLHTRTPAAASVNLGSKVTITSAARFDDPFQGNASYFCHPERLQLSAQTPRSTYPELL